MPLNLEDKKAIVAEVAEIAGTALSAVVADYRGLVVSEMTDLRKQAREKGVYIRVVRNTLARRAVEGTEFACLQEVLTGPTVLAFAQEEPSAAARLLRDFVKENKNLEVKALAISGQLLAADQLEQVAKLPTREEALATLMSVMQAPVTKLARTMKEVPGKLVRTIQAVREAKDAA